MSKASEISMVVNKDLRAGSKLFKPSRADSAKEVSRMEVECMARELF